MDNMVACRHCGKPIHRTTYRCPECRASQLTGRYKNKVIAGVLGIFFGGLGIHRFYLGQWWGLFYLLFWITGIPSFVSIIEGIVMLATNQQAWDDKHNNGVQMPDAGSSSGIVVAIIAGAVFFMIIPVVGILAAIAIPAYQDYTLRAKIANVVVNSQSAKVYVEDYVTKNNAWPPAGKTIAMPEPAPNMPWVNARLKENGVIVLDIQDGNANIDDKTIELEPDASSEVFAWSCKGGTLEQHYRPPECRN